MLHIQCLACFKCLINVKAHNYCAFEPTCSGSLFDMGGFLPVMGMALSILRSLGSAICLLSASGMEKTQTSL